MHTRAAFSRSSPYMRYMLLNRLLSAGATWGIFVMRCVCVCQFLTGPASGQVAICDRDWSHAGLPDALTHGLDSRCRLENLPRLC